MAMFFMANGGRVVLEMGKDALIYMLATHQDIMQYSFLSGRGVIRITGEDTVPFLQGLISNDATRIRAHEGLYAALLSPQGKFLHEFFLTAAQDAIWLETERARLDELMQRMKLYKLRSRVALEALPHLQVAALWDGDALETHENVIAYSDNRLPSLGWRALGEGNALDAWCRQQAVAGDYESYRLAHALPDGSRDLMIDKSILLEFGFDDLNGVDFKKGCYVGQEVTARSKYRGHLKKGLYHISASVPLPEAGTPIMHGDEQAGELRSHAGTAGLALLRHDKAGESLSAGGIRIKAVKPGWMSTEEPPPA